MSELLEVVVRLVEKVEEGRGVQSLLDKTQLSSMGEDNNA